VCKELFNVLLKGIERVKASADHQKPRFDGMQSKE
jgi:hypothetical protein